MFSVANNQAYINGLHGKYDTTIKNPSTRYGRNAISNHIDYLKSYGCEPIECDLKAETETLKKEPTTEEEWEAYFEAIDETLKKTAKYTEAVNKQINNLTPINFELQYMPNCKSGKVDKNALLGASYEEMDGKYTISVEELNKKLNPSDEEPVVVADSLDINKDKRIDIGEYATSILLADILSSESENPSVKDVNGIITNKGENRLLNCYYNSNNNKDTNSNIYSYLYHYFNLGQAKREFMQNPDNFSSNDLFLIQ